jgi:hypothetical protein
LAYLYEQNQNSGYEQQVALFGDNAICLFDEQNHSLSKG